jgi:hypothetical protein
VKKNTGSQIRNKCLYVKKGDLAMLRMRKTYVEQKRQNKAVARVSQLIWRSLMVLKERGDLSV